MKAKVFLAVLGTVILFLTSCSSKKSVTGSEYYPEYDHNVAMMTDFSTKMAEDANGFYYESDESSGLTLLRYIEKSTMEDVILCGKPNCMHTDKTCNGWIQTGTVDGLFLYQGSIYYVTRVPKVDQTTPVLTLMRKSLDGSVEKNVWELTWDSEKISLGTIQYYMLHRGKFYYVIQGDSAWRGVYEYDLNTKKCKEILMTEDYIFELKGIGDYVFWLKHEYQSTEDTAFIGQYHVPSGEIVKERKDTFSVVPNRTHLYFLQKNEARTNKELIRTDRMGENPEKTGIECWTVAVDDKYVYGYDAKVRGWDKTLNIYRIDTWELVETIEIPGQRRVFLMPSSDGKIVAWENPAEVKYYLERDEIGTPDFQWHEVQRIN